MDKDCYRNNVNTWLILQTLQRERDDAYRYAHSGVPLLYRHNTSAASFMGRNPNDQITFAKENGFYPPESLST